MVAVQVLITPVHSSGLSCAFWSSLQCCVWLYLTRPCSLRSGLKPSLLLVLLSYLWLWREIPSRYGRLDYCGFCFSSASVLKSFWRPTIEQIVKHMGWSQFWFWMDAFCPFNCFVPHKVSVQSSRFGRFLLMSERCLVARREIPKCNIDNVFL